MAIKDRHKNTTKRNDDRFQDIKIDLRDIDASIKYYFDNIILPKIDTGYGLIDVPIIYSTPSRWTSVQKYGTFRDKDGKIMAPMITYKRTGIAKNDDMPVNKISAENPQLFYTYEEQYNSKNRYSQFSKLTGLTPSKKIHNVVVPDYVVLSYDIIIWTDKLKQMNKIIEIMNYYAGSYWGTNKWKFKSQIDDYSDSSEVGSDSAKIIKWSCSLTLNGYIVPDIYAKHLPNTTTYSPETIAVSFDVVDNLKEAELAPRGIGSNTSGEGLPGLSEVLIRLLQYIDKQNSKTADIPVVDTNIAIFSNATLAVSPTGDFTTTVDDFMFFVNGVFLDPNVITSFVQSGDDATLTIDGSTAWLFNIDDEIIAIGKFN